MPVPGQTAVSRPLHLVLHIGTRKTGTSSLQFFLRDNRRRLIDLGHLYPESPGRARHERFGLFLKSDEELKRSIEWHRQRYARPSRFRQSFRQRLLREIEESGLSNVLLSDEILFESSDFALQRLGRFTRRYAESLRVVVYLRRQDDYLTSLYQQEVKTGEVRRLDSWVRQEPTDGYDYHARLRTWRRLVGPTDMVVRRFEPGAWEGGSLHQDFLSAVGINARADELEQTPDRNESLDAESVELLRLLNVYRVENHDAVVGLVDNREMVKRLVRASDGPSVTLPESTLDDFMSRWTASNEAVAHEFLGNGTGELFHGPRKSRNVTTEQRLDPDRLDHFIDLLDLPEPWHLPLRRLAEREAGRR